MALCEERAFPSRLRGPVLWPGACVNGAGVGAAGMGAGAADAAGVSMLLAHNGRGAACAFISLAHNGRACALSLLRRHFSMILSSSSSVGTYQGHSPGGNGNSTSSSSRSMAVLPKMSEGVIGELLVEAACWRALRRALILIRCADMKVCSLRLGSVRNALRGGSAGQEDVRVLTP